MELDKIMQKRIRAMGVRILACIEHSLSCHLDDIEDGDRFELIGEDLKVLRSEILNAAGDTSRSLGSLVSDPKNVNTRLSLERDVIEVLTNAEFGIVEHEDGDDVPAFVLSGNLNTLLKIRDLIDAGVVYNNKYTCVGVEDIVNRLLPFLDKVKMTGIKIPKENYAEWRDEVCELYTGGLGNV